MWKDEEPTCPSCGGDDIECLDNCTKHKCVSCGKEHKEPEENNVSKTS